MSAAGLAGLFAVSVFTLGAWLVFASGMFPAVARPGAMHGVIGNLLLLTGSAMTFALAGLALHTAMAAELPLAWLVIGGGAGALLSPLPQQLLPTRVLDSPLAASLHTLLATVLCLAWLAG